MNSGKDQKPRTLFDKIWDAHEIRRLSDGRSLLHIDRHVLHEITSVSAFADLEAAGRRVRNPELTAATQDHIPATRPGRTEDTFPPAREFVVNLRKNAKETGIRLFDLGDPHQGIAHVIAPELGITLPGLTLVCADSHTCTNGALGAVAFGIGSSDAGHVLATQTLALAKPKTLRITIDGELPFGATAKDLALYIIGRFGAGVGNGYAVEYVGAAITALSVEARFTLCNLSVEFGSRIGLIAPDEKTLDYVRGRPYAPKEETWKRAVAHWRTLYSDEDAPFDQEIRIDAAEVEPMITWGTSPEDAVPIGAVVPDPARLDTAELRHNKQAALDYMGLKPGAPLDGLPVSMVFIGSCTNSRISDLREVARIVSGKRVADGVRALVVPGSTAVKAAAEAEGIDKVLSEAGFEWHESGCSLCCALGADLVPSGQRCVSTANRNFEGRQGPGGRTHLASPAMAAAAAVTGTITDVRRLESQG